MDDGIQIEPFNLNKEIEEGYVDDSENSVEYAKENEIKKRVIVKEERGLEDWIPPSPMPLTTSVPPSTSKEERGLLPLANQQRLLRFSPWGRTKEKPSIRPQFCHKLLGLGRQKAYMEIELRLFYTEQPWPQQSLCSLSVCQQPLNLSMVMLAASFGLIAKAEFPAGVYFDGSTKRIEQSSVGECTDRSACWLHCWSVQECLVLSMSTLTTKYPMMKVFPKWKWYSLLQIML